MFYATLSQVESEMKAQKSISPDRSLRHVRQVSERVNKLMTGKATRNVFWPTIATYQIPIDAGHVNSYLNTLLLDNNPLLELTTVTADGTVVTANTSGYPAGQSPIHALRISSSGNHWYSYISQCDDPAYVSIAGIWGYHSDYANAWLLADTLSAAITTTTATTFTVSDIDGDDLFGFAGRISAGSLVKIDSEYMIVTKTDPNNNNVATVKRGAQGSTAATHLIGANVYVWQVEEPIAYVTARQAAMLYAREGAFAVETVDGIGTISYPQDLLRSLAKTVQEYINAE